jgi:hypothetical protein
MKPIIYALTALGLAIVVGRVLQSHTRELKRKNAIAKPKPEALQEWEGEGGALRVPVQTPLAASALPTMRR